MTTLSMPGKMNISQPLNIISTEMLILSSMTTLGDLLDIGQLFKAFGNNEFAQISHILSQFLERSHNLSFSSEINFGKLL